MRCAIVIAALLAFAAPASADVLVPADPPADAAWGVTAAGDIVAFEHRGGATAYAAGRRLPITGFSPAVAAAADGTAVVAALGRRGIVIRVRRPGQPFAAALALGGSASLYELAAAPGGWVAAAWLSPQADRVEAAVVDPSGKVRRALLDRGRNGKRSWTVFSIPQVGIDAAGRATVAWSRWRLSDDGYSGTRQRIRVARSSRGWRTTDLAPGAEPIFGQPEWPLLDVVVTPGGRSLIAWATKRGIEASEDGRAPTTLARARRPGSPTAAMTDDRAALIAYSQAGRILAVDRAAGGAFGARHRLSGRPGPGPEGAPPEGYPWPTTDGDDGSDDVALTSALAVDGRAVVGWATGDGTAAATGRAGAAWTPAGKASLPTRMNDQPPVATLDGAGDPWLVWLESTVFADDSRARGARLVPDALAPAPDTTAPVLTAQLPTTARFGRRLSLRVPVSCSEACDVRVRILLPDIAVPDLAFAVSARWLQPGASATVVITPRSVVQQEWREEPPREITVDVLATDRAGNTASAAGTVRILGR